MPDLALPARLPEAPGLAALTHRRIVPLRPQEVIPASVPLLARPDPVLRNLAHSPNEAPYRIAYDTEPAISTAQQDVTDDLLSEGWSLQAASSSPAAQRLRDIGDAALTGMRGLEAAFEAMAMADLLGWKPMQLQWSPQAFSVGGRSMWGVTRLLGGHETEHYSFTAADQTLAYTRDEFSQSPIVFSAPEDRMRWVVARSSSDPYGNPRLRRLYGCWYLKQRFIEMFAKGFRAAVSGVPVMKEGLSVGSGFASSPGEGDDAAKMAAFRAEAQRVLDVYDEAGILLLRGGVDLELFTNVAYSSGWLEALKYWDHKLEIAVRGEMLTTTVEDTGGAFAASKTHQASKRNRSCRLAASVIEPVINRDVLPLILAMNVLAAGGGQLDPGDLPRFTLGINSQVDLARARSFVDMGGELDSVRVAESLNLPIHDPETSVGEPLRRQQRRSLRDMIGEEEQSEAPPEATPRTSVRTGADFGPDEDEEREALAAALGASRRRVEPTLRAYVGSLRRYAEARTEEGPPPFDPAR